jgi:hypothetical protein
MLFAKRWNFFCMLVGTYSSKYMAATLGFSAVAAL